MYKYIMPTINLKNEEKNNKHETKNHKNRNVD